MTPRQMQMSAREPGSRCCSPELSVSMEGERVARFADDLKTLAHPLRIRILDILLGNEGKVCVCDLVAALPVSQPTVSHHLRILREAGVVECTYRGVWAHYFVNRRRLAEVAAEAERFFHSGEQHDENARTR